MDLDTLSSATDVLRTGRMTPEASFLLAALREPGTRPPASVDWDALVVLAESHGVLPLFCRSLPGQLPAELVARYRSRWVLSLSLARELEGILGHFERHGVEILPLKGPVLADLLYGEVSLRPSDDLDLLVRREEFSRAEALLAELGFEPASNADDYHRNFRRNGIFVELHFAIASPSAPHFDLPGAWARARRLEFHGHPIRFLSPVDLVLYLALHGIKHRFARLIWVLDVARALQPMDESSASRLLGQASARQLRNILLTACEVAHRSFAIELPPAIGEALRTQPALAARAVSIADGILDTVADPTTSVHDAGYYLQLADNPGHRWRQRFQFFLPTRQDYRWVARHRIHRSCAPFVRPFRLLLKYGPVPAFRTLFSRWAKIWESPQRFRRP